MDESEIDLPKTFEISLYEGLVGEGSLKKTCDPFTVTWTSGAITKRVIRYFDTSTGYIEEEHAVGDEVLIGRYPHNDIPLGQAFDYWEDSEANQYNFGQKIVLNNSLELTPNFFNGFNVVRFVLIEPFSIDITSIKVVAFKEQHDGWEIHMVTFTIICIFKCFLLDITLFPAKGFYFKNPF